MLIIIFVGWMLKIPCTRRYLIAIQMSMIATLCLDFSPAVIIEYFHQGKLKCVTKYLIRDNEPFTDIFPRKFFNAKETASVFGVLGSCL